MLDNAELIAFLSMSDPSRARRFFAETLGYGWSRRVRMRSSST
jgi:hypothetical protein